MRKRFLAGTSIVALLAIIVSCGTGITGLEGFATAVRTDSSTVAMEFAQMSTPQKVIYKVASLFGVEQAYAAASGSFDVPNLHWGPDCPRCKVKPECATLDTFDTGKNILSIVPSAISGGKIGVGSTIMVAIVSEGVNGYQPGKEDCGYTNQAITDNWVFTLTGCDDATIVNGPHDGEALITGVTNGGDTCSLQATGRDAAGTLTTGSLNFTVTDAANIPVISSIKIDGETIDYLKPVKFDFKGTVSFSVTSSTTITESLTDWRASIGQFGETGSNTFNWSAYEGAVASAVLVTIKETANDTLNQVKFMAVE